MDSEEIKVLSLNKQREYRMWDALFVTPGWRQFIDDTTEIVNDIPIKAFWQAASWDEILAARATYTELTRIISQEGIIDSRVQADLTDPDSQEAQ